LFNCWRLTSKTSLQKEIGASKNALTSNIQNVVKGVKEFIYSQYMVSAVIIVILFIIILVILF
jgi:hypothetical protein